ncbi:Smad nuclear-interacting protein 1 [Sticta canariensis]|nr:Smad nuclear-interacting protein 1 [Sticta canariensis]
MPNQRSDQVDRRRTREASLSSHSDLESLRRRPQKRARDWSGDRDYGYDELRASQRRRYRSQSPIDRRRHMKRELRRSRSPPPLHLQNQSSRSEYDQPQRRGIFSSPSLDHHRRASQVDRNHYRQIDGRSRSPPSPCRPPSPRDNNRAAYRGRDSSPRSSRHRHRDSHVSHRHPSRKKNHSSSPSRHHSRSLPVRPLTTQRSLAPLPSQEDAYRGKSLSNPSEGQLQRGSDPPPEKQKPNYAPSGKLAAETNTVANTSIVLKYNEPPEARLPPTSSPWRLYIFKGDSVLDTLHLQTSSCWLFGRERLVVDCAIDHPSCSKQHAVIQFRYVVVKNEYGDKEGGVKPYVIDLESANGTKVNGDLVPQRRYVELKSKDVITFGESTREYVLVLPPKD